MQTTKLIRLLLESFTAPCAANTARRAQRYGFKEEQIQDCISILKKQGLIASVSACDNYGQPFSACLLALTPTGARVLSNVRR